MIYESLLTNVKSRLVSNLSSLTTLLRQTPAIYVTGSVSSGDVYIGYKSFPERKKVEVGVYISEESASEANYREINLGTPSFEGEFTVVITIHPELAMTGTTSDTLKIAINQARAADWLVKCFTGSNSVLSLEDRTATILAVDIEITDERKGADGSLYVPAVYAYVSYLII